MHAHTDRGRDVCVKVVQINKLSGKLCDMGTPAILPECFALSPGATGLDGTTIRSQLQLELKMLLRIEKSLD